MQRMVAEMLAPARAAGRAALQAAMLGLLAGSLALTGVVLLLVAVCIALVPLVGVAGALALTGLAFMILAGGTLLVARTDRSVSLPDEPRQQPDPLVQMIFDLSFNIGQSLRQRRH